MSSVSTSWIVPPELRVGCCQWDMAGRNSLRHELTFALTPAEARQLAERIYADIDGALCVAFTHQGFFDASDFAAYEEAKCTAVIGGSAVQTRSALRAVVAAIGHDPIAFAESIKDAPIFGGNVERFFSDALLSTLDRLDNGQGNLFKDDHSLRRDIRRALVSISREPNLPDAVRQSVPGDVVERILTEVPEFKLVPMDRHTVVPCAFDPVTFDIVFPPGVIIGKRADKTDGAHFQVAWGSIVSPNRRAYLVHGGNSEGNARAADDLEFQNDGWHYGGVNAHYDIVNYGTAHAHSVVGTAHGPMLDIVMSSGHNHRMLAGESRISPGELYRCRNMLNILVRLGPVAAGGNVQRRTALEIRLVPIGNEPDTIMIPSGWGHAAIPISANSECFFLDLVSNDTLHDAPSYANSWMRGSPVKLLVDPRGRPFLGHNPRWGTLPELKWVAPEALRPQLLKPVLYDNISDRNPWAGRLLNDPRFEILVHLIHHAIGEDIRSLEVGSTENDRTVYLVDADNGCTLKVTVDRRVFPVTDADDPDAIESERLVYDWVELGEDAWVINPQGRVVSVDGVPPPLECLAEYRTTGAAAGTLARRDLPHKAEQIGSITSIGPVGEGCGLLASLNAEHLLNSKIRNRLERLRDSVTDKGTVPSPAEIFGKAALDLPYAEHWTAIMGPVFGRQWVSPQNRLMPTVAYFEYLKMVGAGYFDFPDTKRTDPHRAAKHPALSPVLDAFRNQIASWAEHLPAANVATALQAVMVGNSFDLGLPREIYSPETVLVDDSERIAGALAADGVDAVGIFADNAGAELLNLIALAVLLAGDREAGGAGISEVKLYLKPYPCFTSDAMKSDLIDALAAMEDGDAPELLNLATTFRGLQQQHRIIIEEPIFAADGTSFESLAPDHHLRREIETNDVNVFVGDVWYRRLTGDGKYGFEFTPAQAVPAWCRQVVILRATKSEECMVGTDRKALRTALDTPPDDYFSGRVGLIQFIEGGSPPPPSCTFPRPSVRMTELVDFIMKTRQEGRPAPAILAYCYTDRLALKAALLSCCDTDSMPLIMVTTNQVNIDGGYTGLNAKQLVAMVNDLADEAGYHGPIIFGRDHGGPYILAAQRTEPRAEIMDWVKKNITADLEAGFSCWHADGTSGRHDEEVDGQLPLELVAGTTLEMIDFCEQERQRLGLEPISYEVGSEEQKGGLTAPASFDRYIELLRAGLAERRLDNVRIDFIVAQTGTHMRLVPEESGDYVLRQTGFKPELVEVLDREARKHRNDRQYYLFTQHYSDEITPADAVALRESGAGKVNFGPEMTMPALRMLLEWARIEQKQLEQLGRLDLASGFCDAMLRELNKHEGFWRGFAPRYDEAGKSVIEETLLSFHSQLQDAIIVFRGRYVLGNPPSRRACAALIRNIVALGIHDNPEDAIVQHIRTVVIQPRIEQLLMNDILEPVLTDVAIVPSRLDEAAERLPDFPELAPPPG